MSEIHEIQRAAQGVRRRVLAYTLRNNGGYLSQACSSAEILSALYLGIMNLGPSEAPMIPLPFPGTPGIHNPEAFTGAGYNGPKAPHLDRFIFSPVHYALVLYSVLIETGRLAPEALEQFNRDGSSVELIGAEHSPGHEVTAGSLAQAISQAGGVALARKLRGETGRVYVFMSDGEFQEGQTWEAIAALAFHRVDNISVYVDVNGQCCDGALSSVMNITPLARRLQTFGADVSEIDGHNIPSLLATRECRAPGKPQVFLALTDPCRNIDLLRPRSPKLHYVRFKDADEFAAYETFLERLNREAAEGESHGIR